jgi:hypothetical protein
MNLAILIEFDGDHGRLLSKRRLIIVAEETVPPVPLLILKVIGAAAGNQVHRAVVVLKKKASMSPSSLPSLASPLTYGPSGFPVVLFRMPRSPGGMLSVMK